MPVWLFRIMPAYVPTLWWRSCRDLASSTMTLCGRDPGDTLPQVPRPWKPHPWTPVALFGTSVGKAVKLFLVLWELCKPQHIPGSLQRGESLNNSLNEISIKWGLTTQVEFDLEGIKLCPLLSTWTGSGATELLAQINALQDPRGIHT